MATFSFTDPNGRQYSINGPDGSTPEQAVQILQQQLGSQQQPQGATASPRLTPVTDPDLLRQLNGDDETSGTPRGLKPVTDQDLLRQLNAPPSAGDQALDVAKGTAKGLAEGTTGLAGMGGDLETAADNAFNKYLPAGVAKALHVAGLMAVAPGAAVTSAARSLAGGDNTNVLPTTSQIDSASGVDSLPAPQTSLGQHAENITSFLPAALGGPDGVAKNLLMRGVIPGVASDAAGTVAEGTPLEMPARMAGALLAARGTKAPELPSADELRSAADAGYDQARSMPVSIKPSSASQWAGTTQVNLAKQGFNDKLAPNTHTVLDELQNVPANAGVTMDNIDTARKTLGNIAGNYSNPTEQAAASKAINGLDDYITNLSPTDVLSGDARAAANTWADARGNYAAAKRADAIADAQDTAQLNADAANSGHNVGSTTRQQFKKLLTSDAAGRGFDDDELDQVRKIVQGSTVGNLARNVSNVLGAGGGLGQGLAMAAGGYAGSQADGGEGAAAGAILPLLAGSLARRFSNNTVMRQVSRLSEMTRARSPLASAANGGGPLSAIGNLQQSRASNARAVALAQLLRLVGPSGQQQ